MSIHKFPVGGGVNIVARFSRVARGIWYVHRDDERSLPDGNESVVFGSYTDQTDAAHAEAEKLAVAYAVQAAKDVR